MVPLRKRWTGIADRCMSRYISPIIESSSMWVKISNLRCIHYSSLTASLDQRRMNRGGSFAQSHVFDRDRRISDIGHPKKLDVKCHRFRLLVFGQRRLEVFRDGSPDHSNEKSSVCGWNHL